MSVDAAPSAPPPAEKAAPPKTPEDGKGPQAEETNRRVLDIAADRQAYGDHDTMQHLAADELIDKAAKSGSLADQNQAAHAQTEAAGQNDKESVTDMLDRLKTEYTLPDQPTSHAAPETAPLAADLEATRPVPPTAELTTPVADPEATRPVPPSAEVTTPVPARPEAATPTPDTELTAHMGPENAMSPEQQQVAERRNAIAMGAELQRLGIDASTSEGQALVDMLAENPAQMEAVRKTAEAMNALREAGGSEVEATSAQATAEALQREVNQTESNGDADPKDIADKKALIVILLAIAAGLALAIAAPPAVALVGTALAGAASAKR